MEGSGSSGFALSKMSTADKMLAGGGILLLIASFLPWQKFCADLGELGDLVGQDTICAATLNAWQGSGGVFGILMGLLTIALVATAILSITGTMSSVNMGTMSPDRLISLLGLGVFGFGMLKFLFVLFNEAGWGAFIGLLVLLAIGWGAWQKLQAGGGFQMGGGGMTGSGGAMDGGPPPGMPPPSEPPPGTPPPSTPPPGGAPPPGSSDM